MKKHSLFIFCLILFRLNIFAQLVPGFTIPDTICINQPFNIVNTTTGGSTYYWNFCSGNLSNNPIGLNMGNLGSLNRPVYSAIVTDSNKYYVFITNNYDGTLARLSFGNSLTNTPVATSLGTLGVLSIYTEGIQIKKDSVTGTWIGWIAWGQNNCLARLNFGTSLNNIPTVTVTGNIGGTFNLAHTLYLFNENNNWYGLVGNAGNSTIVRLSFGASLNNIPTAVNLGNIGTLSTPVGFYPILDNGTWYLFVVSRDNNSLSRLNFGNSLLNTPTGVNLGNVNNTMNLPRSITIIRDCGQVFGLVVNEQTSDLVRLTFPSGLTTVPTGVSLGNIANFSFPHQLSELFRVGDTLYSFVTNVNNNTISRLSFASCTNASIASSNLQNPLPISYNTIGTYNINLTVNEGLPTQANICKQIVVVNSPVVNLGNDTTLCSGNFLTLNAGNPGATYLWNTGATTQQINVSTSGTYSVKVTNSGGCSGVDTINVSFINPVANFSTPDTICVNTSFNIQNLSTCASSYFWNFCSGNLSNNPIGLNMGNLGSVSGPVYSAILKEGTNYYVFISNYSNGTLTRLSFGNSLINTPVSTNLGNLGVLQQYIEGIQIKKDSVTGNWYGFICGGANNYLARLNFGTSLANTPTATNFGNINSLFNYPHPIYIFQENGNWYGYITQQLGSNLLRLSFGPSLSNTPTIIDLGNIGSLNGPVGFYPIIENGNWYLFVTNEYTNSLSRLTFGNSLLNTPTGVNLGGINNTMHDPRSITILRDCNNIIGFIINEATNDLVRLTFPSGLTSTPLGVSLGNIANFSFPHNISELFRVGDSLYCFIMNESNSTIARLCFPSCTNASIASSNLQNPLPISYNALGTYNINLTVNEGLPSQSNICKQIVVVGSLSVHLGNDTTLCYNTITLNAGNPGSTYLWSTGATTQQINVNTSETYSVKVTNSGGCIGTDTINVIVNPNPVPILDTINVSNDGILAHYQFDNDTYDISGHNYTGILNGPTPTTDRYNIPNKAYYFNGNNQYVGVPYDVWSDELTLSAWFYATDFGDVTQPLTGRLIFFKAPNTGYNIDYYLNIGLVNTIPKAGFVFGQGVGNYMQIISNNNLQLNQWYLLTATRKNGVAKLYINGNLDNSATYSFIPYNQHYGLRLGMSNSSFQSFAGKLDDLRIYKRELCAREIKSLYHKQYILKTHLQDTVVCTNGNTVLQLINPEPGITYQLLNSPSGTPYGSPVVTFCDTILSIPINNIITTSYYKLYATDTVTGCNRLLDSIKISVSPSPIVNLGNDTTICNGSSLTLNAGNVGSSYLWNTGAITQQISVSTTGNYWVKVTNSYGCIGIDTIHVTFSPLYVNLGNDTTLCTGSSLTLNAGNIGSTYSWNTGETTQQINVSTSGIFSVKVTNSSGCVGSDTIIVNVLPPPIVNLGNDTSFCQGGSIVLDAQNIGASYLWNTGATTQQINASITGNYWVNVTIGSCQSSDNITINVIPKPIINLGNDTNLCMGSSLILNAGNAGSTYLWNTGATTQQITVSTTGDYWAKVTNSFGCIGIDTINLTFSPLYVNIGNDTTLCIGDSVTLNAGITGATYQWNTGAITQSINVSDAGNYWVQVNWDNCNNSDTIIINTVQKPVVNLGKDTIMCPGDLIILNAGSGYTYLWSDGSTQATLNVNYPGTYSVTVSNAGCKAFDEIKIAECNSEIWVPNVFTPNGDGLNDTFYPVCTNIDEITMYVYNRWGNEIFKGSGRNLKWDGTYKGKMCPDGVYYYLIDYTYKGNGHVELKQLHGSVTLLK